MNLMQKSGDHTVSGSEGYIYVTYGPLEYLKHTVASVVTLRRYDKERPVALVCSSSHKAYLKEQNLEYLFDKILFLEDKHASIVGFKHNVHHYRPFDRNLYLDSDVIWCKDPDPLWVAFSIYGYTITGNQISDIFFGASKNMGVFTDIFLGRRQRTLKRFGLTYLSRVQSGMIYSEDPEQTKEVGELAASILERREETHFQSRLKERGRNEESCEWSLAMAMASLKLPVFPWFQGQNSPQLDFIDSYTSYDPDFTRVSCLYYSDPFVYSFRGLKTDWWRKLLIRLFTLIPGKGDYMETTPYCLHFGWYHHKQPFYDFADKTWDLLTESASTSS